MLLIVFGAVVFAVVTAGWLGVRRQQRALAEDRDRLVSRATLMPVPRGSLLPATVPAPVERYLRLALRTSRQIQEVRIGQAGTLRTDPRTERWMSFTADHLVVPAAAGFVWDARVRVAPLLHVRVRDSLIEGRGAGQVSLLSAFAISAAAGTPEMNSGSLHRYLAEAVWYPTALLPGGNVQWTAIDATRALATLTDHGVSVSLEFRFADTGEVTGIYTPARWGTFAGGYREAPWEGHFRGYRERDGLLVPTEGEVGWHVDDEWRLVWEGSITAFQVRFAE